MGFLDNVIGGGFTKTLSGFGGIGSTIGNGLAGIGSAIGAKYNDGFSDSQITTQNLGNQALGMLGPVGQVLQVADGLFRGLSTATNTNLSNINPDSAKRLNFKGAATANNVLNHMPLVAGLAGGFGLWSDRIGNYQLSDEAASGQSAFSGSVGYLRSLQDIANKRVLGGKNWGFAKQGNDLIDTGKRMDDVISQTMETNTNAIKNNYWQQLLTQNQNRWVGENYSGYQLGKNGMKLMTAEEARKMIKKKSVEEIKEEPKEPVTGIDTNILPEGSLHARLNHLSELNDDLKDATKKGIPVMAAEEGGELNQVAEIEHSELILRLEVTQRLEELRADGSEEAMIEAGKLIVQELKENTQDNFGMLTKEDEHGED